MYVVTIPEGAGDVGAASAEDLVVLVVAGFAAALPVVTGGFELVAGLLLDFNEGTTTAAFPTVLYTVARTVLVTVGLIVEQARFSRMKP